jgi:sigma-B regulation protein RsbU (phosphoserine phosphatase)
MESPRILIADDQPHVCDALRLLLKSEGFVPEAVSSPSAVMQAVHERSFDVLLLDLNYARDTTSGGEGLELLARIRDFDSSLPVVLMTAWANIDLAVQAMQGGGRDFVQKPWDNDKLLASLRRQIEEGRLLREKNREIEEAREIQRRLLPDNLSKVSGCDIQVFWKPAKEVGGDYFDAIPLMDSTSAFCIADVGGKGLPAALLMSNMQASVRALAAGTSSPAEMCRQLNRVVLENTRSERLTTFFYGVVDSSRRTLSYSNAGHVPPFLVHQDGHIDRLTKGGIVFGVGSVMEYQQAEMSFKPGDRLVLLTDGITEAMNRDEEEFGDDRIIRLLHEHRHLGCTQLQQKLLDAVVSYAAEGLRDDAILVTVALTEEQVKPIKALRAE